MNNSPDPTAPVARGATAAGEAAAAATEVSAAEARYRAGDYAAAAALLLPLAAEVSPLPAALRVLGMCHLRLGAPLEALGLLERAHRLAPDDPWSRLHHGIGLQAVGRHAEAAVLLRAAHALLPHDPAPLLNLSSSLLQLGDRAGAVRAARKGRLRAPGMPQAHYTLGMAYLACERLGCAADSFRRAIALAPGLADAWVNLGVVRYRTGDVAGAKQAMRAALAADPDHQAAAANLGGFLRLTGETEASEALLQGVVERQPGALAARINLAADLLQEDRAAEALELLGGRLPAERGMRQHWLLQQALALIKLNRLVEARAALDSLGQLPPSLRQLLHWREALLASAERRLGDARGHALQMEAALAADASALPEHRIMGHYNLAKFWSGVGELDRAFSGWRAGHRLLAQFQPFSRREHAAFIDATIACFDMARMRDGPRGVDQDQAPVFVVGMPRSGTTLIEQILSAHRDVFGAGERPALGRMFQELSGGCENAAAAAKIAALDAPTLDAAASRYLQELHATEPDASRVVDKMPGNCNHLGLIASMLPGARVIACDRDPRDIGLSIFTYRFYGSHGYAHDLADLGWYIGEHRRLMAHWRKVLPSRMITVRLSDWVEDFSATLRRVLDFLGLPHDPACERFHEVQRRVRTVSRAQVQERVNARGLGRWRAYEAQLAPLISELERAGALDAACEEKV